MAAVLLLVGVAGRALAQPGLITDPWPARSPRVFEPAPLNDLPASGLPDVDPVLPRPQRPKWQPPVVELLVDPWDDARVSVRPEALWAPRVSEIIDPWAGRALPDPPGVARGSPRKPRSTIF